MKDCSDCTGEDDSTDRYTATVAASLTPWRQAYLASYQGLRSAESDFLPSRLAGEEPVRPTPTEFGMAHPKINPILTEK